MQKRLFVAVKERLAFKDGAYPTQKNGLSFGIDGRQEVTGLGWGEGIDDPLE